MSSFLTVLKDLMEKNVIIRGLIALVLLCTVAYMQATGQEVSNEFYQLVTAALMFYFGGTKVEAKTK